MNLTCILTCNLDELIITFGYDIFLSILIIVKYTYVSCRYLILCILCMLIFSSIDIIQLICGIYFQLNCQYQNVLTIACTLNCFHLFIRLCYIQFQCFESSKCIRFSVAFCFLFHQIGEYIFIDKFWQDNHPLVSTSHAYLLIVLSFMCLVGELLYLSSSNSRDKTLYEKLDVFLEQNLILFKTHKQVIPVSEISLEQINIIKDGECSICLDTLTEQQTTIICQHTFHSECIGKWLQIKPSCPVCRQDIKASILG